MVETNRPVSGNSGEARESGRRFRSPRARRPSRTARVTNIVVSAKMSLTGLTFSPDGRRLYLSNTGGNIWVFEVDDDRQVSVLTNTLVLPNYRGKDKDVPSGLAVSPDGRHLYVAGNLGNKLYEFDLASGAVSRSWKVGVAPFDVAWAAGKVFVSNQGGRRPGKDDVKAVSGKGGSVRVDPVRYIASEGSVSIVDLASGLVRAELLTGLHATALAVSPNHRYVVVANAGSDTLSVIDTRIDLVVEKIWARLTPADLFGAQPNALTFDRRGRRLFVCNGTQNAVAVVEFDPADNASKVVGLIPTGWFPGAVALDTRGDRLFVANIKGMSTWKTFKTNETVKFQTRDFYGTVSHIPVPSRRQLARHTESALANMRYPKLKEAFLPARLGQPPRPVPERVGEPSVFKHVIYVIKENRSYDQVLGDVAQGNGDPSLCVFGEKYTPNQHKIAREFVLLDNTYCSGVQSADGHQWADSAMANSYMERQLTAEYPRSYPSGKTEDGLDALAWASSGFLWDNAMAHGKTFRNYGEWMISQADWKVKKGRGKEKPSWRDFWNDLSPEIRALNPSDSARRGIVWALQELAAYPDGVFSIARFSRVKKEWWPNFHAYSPYSNVTTNRLTRLASRAGIASLRQVSATNSVGWDLNVPDVMRANEFIKELRQFEANGGFPNLMILFLPNDHTGGTRGRSPTPGAQVADNDLAFGRVVEAVSHSKFWPETCIIAIEDDPQAGWDHVSGYRTTCYVASPYTKRRATVGTQYNQTSVIRTIELILGLPPMNQLDATATPMFDCFTANPDFTPFRSVPNRTPLDELNPDPKKIASAVLRQDAIQSAALPPRRTGPLPGGLAQPDPVARDERSRRALSRVGGEARDGR